jgi:hypothetical protein
VFQWKGGIKVSGVREQINTLIVQGWLLREGKPTEITMSEWFEMYHELADTGEIRGPQKTKVDEHATQLGAMRFAADLSNQPKVQAVLLES